MLDRCAQVDAVAHLVVALSVCVGTARRPALRAAGYIYHRADYRDIPFLIHMVAQLISDPQFRTRCNSLIVVFIVSGLKRINSVQMPNRIQRIIELIGKVLADLTLFLFGQILVCRLRQGALLAHTGEIGAVCLRICVILTVILHLLKCIDCLQHLDHLFYRRGCHGFIYGRILGFSCHTDGDAFPDSFIAGGILCTCRVNCSCSIGLRALSAGIRCDRLCCGICSIRPFGRILHGIARLAVNCCLNRCFLPSNIRRADG